MLCTTVNMGSLKMRRIEREGMVHRSKPRERSTKNWNSPTGDGEL